MKAVHYTNPYLLNPMHPITIGVIGVGGTGSRLLTNLAMVNEGLISLGHPGIIVHAIDDDFVSEANVGRQQFSPADIGFPKAAILISRINRFYGYNWKYEIKRVEGDKISGNIIITCVDKKNVRKKIEKAKQETESRHELKTLYWIDCGNGKDYGQVVLSGKDKKWSGTGKLQTPSQLSPGCFNGRDSNEPSCSLADALRHQDLFINTSVAMYASQLLWNLFTQGMVDYQGVYINMKSLQVNKIKIHEQETGTEVHA